VAVGKDLGALLDVTDLRLEPVGVAPAPPDEDDRLYR
jgi:hypothetical protein